MAAIRLCAIWLFCSRQGLPYANFSRCTIGAAVFTNLAASDLCQVFFHLLRSLTCWRFAQRCDDLAANNHPFRDLRDAQKVLTSANTEPNSSRHISGV